MIDVYYCDGYRAPIGDHIMPMEKFGQVAERLAGDPRAKLIEPSPVTMGDLLRVHTPEYIRAIETGEPRPLAESQKFPWSAELFASVCLTGGGLLAAARSALVNGVAAALVSGFHHAHPDHGEGFCTFNGLAITADALRAAGLIGGIAVLDLDLHYGNGTAACAATRPYLRQLSIYGNDYHNNQPFRDVSIRRHADGLNHVSVALPAGCDGSLLQATLDEHLPALLLPQKPAIILYQAGADPFRDDPYSPLDLGLDDLKERDRTVFRFARTHGIPIAWVLAGGYTRDIGQIVQAHVNTFDACADVFCP